MGSYNNDGQTVELNKEDFSMQRAFLFALTIRSDVPESVKAHLQEIERKLSSLADVKSHFGPLPVVEAI